MSIKENFINLIDSLKLEVAVIKSFNYDKNPPTMNVALQLPNGDSDDYEINIPFGTGAGGSGSFSTPEVGTRVICGRVPDTPEQFHAICYIPSAASSAEISENPAPHTPHDAVSYPTIKSGSHTMQNKHGFKIDLHENGMDFITSFNRGMRFFIDRLKTNAFSAVNDFEAHTDAHEFVSGNVKRHKDGGYGARNITSPTPEGYSHTKSSKIERGVFPESRVRRSYINGVPKNYSRTAVEFTARQFSYLFKGYSAMEEESESQASARLTKEQQVKHAQSEDLNNILHLNPSKLIQMIAGNVVSSKGEVLDSNFQGLKFGKTPKAEKKKHYTAIAELESRAIGMVLQLDTSFQNEDVSNNIDNFIMLIEKSGFLSLNVPKTKDTGSVFKRQKVNFSDGLNGRTYSSNIKYSQDEEIPIMLWYEGSSYPNKIQSSDGLRKTGLYHRGTDQYNLERNESDAERIHLTGYHNMISACESIYGNYPMNIYVPELSVNLNNSPKTQASCFEVPSGSKKIKIVRDDNSTSFISNTYSSLLEVKSAMPAIRPGAEVSGSGSIYCGTSKNSIGPYSNNFTVVEDEDKSSKDKKYKAKFDDKTLRTGGKSANLNFEGSIECSVGKDNVDGKSIVLDTDGELVAWFGAGNKRGQSDNIPRSASIQTDGSVAINIGGSRIKNEKSKEFTRGRLDIRVNVVDKGTLNNPNPTEESDYIISIGPHGLVISGGQKDKPMLFRNKGDLLFESSHGQIKMSSASKIVYKTSSNPYRDIGSDQYARNARDGDVDDILGD